MAKGILVDYEWCSGCHTCEMACTVELSHTDYPENHCGVKIHHEGLFQISEDKWNDIYMPIFNDLCDVCVQRLENGEPEPSCVKHCQAHCLTYGEVEDLAKKLSEKAKQTLYCLEAQVCVWLARECLLAFP